MDKNTLGNMALGAVIGSAVGDALGAPFEFGAPGGYRHRFPEPVVGGIGEMVGGRGWKPAEFTDDTQMALAQAESLLVHGGVDGADLFDRFRVWSTLAADVGIQTRQVLRSGLPWNEAANDHFRRNPSRAAGNGSVMRSAASAVFFANHTVEGSMTAARDLAAVTHGDPAAGWGTAIYHALIHVALDGQDPFQRLPEILAFLPNDQQRYQGMLSPLWTPNQDRDLPNGSVWGCLAQAVWAVRTTSSFSDAVTNAIDLGGDTDTVAAVAGGVAGAIYGIQNIPCRWTTYLNGTVMTPTGPRQYALRDLQRLTLALIDSREGREADEHLPEGPTEIADGLYAANLAGASKVPTEWAVVSLCRVGDRFVNHPMRRELYLIDGADGQNGCLASAVLDALNSIDAFLAEGRKVVVHCHAGASRTALILRAWLMRLRRLSITQATELVADRWPLITPSSNASFATFLRDEWIVEDSSSAEG